jgi:FMN phosphatase YigB (HAD superfamily)
MQAKSWRLGRKIIAFDLDDTLIPRERAFATEELASGDDRSYESDLERMGLVNPEYSEMFGNNQKLAERSYRRERKEREEDLQRMRRDHDYAALIRAIGEETERIFNDFPTAGHREQLGQVLGVGEGPTPCFGDLRLRRSIC